MCIIYIPTCIKTISYKCLTPISVNRPFILLKMSNILVSSHFIQELNLLLFLEMYYQYICEFRDWLKSEETVVADLSKRTDDLYSYKASMDESVDGSFRQLIID